MPVEVWCKRLPDGMPGSEDEFGRRRYSDVYEIDQIDDGPLASPVAIAITAQSANEGPDIVPLRGDNYSYAGFTDEDAYVQKFAWSRPHPTDLPRRIHLAVESLPIDGTTPGQLAEPDPLLWPTEYWVEWTEESVPLARARIVESLDHISRAAGTDGPIINSAGQETITPQMKTVFYPILCCKKAYATLEDIIALNNAFQDSTNGGVEEGMQHNTFFGAPPRTAKYLLTEAGHVQRTKGVTFYLGITRIWFKIATWDREIVNNGLMTLLWKNNVAGGVYLGQDFPVPFDYPKLYPYKIREVSYDSQGEPVEGNWVSAPEPANLNMDGTPKPPTHLSDHLHYRYLNELDYLGIGIGGAPP